MAKRRLFGPLAKTLIALVAGLVLVPGSWAIKSGKERRFNGSDGAGPMGGLTSDGAGNFYGTASNGGLVCQFTDCGIAFKMTLGQDGSWKGTVIYKFKGGTDGFSPSGTMAFDSVGNLYGTTTAGGSRGTVFRLSPNQDGTWTESVIYSFQGNADGGAPESGVIADSAGNLYGTTTDGGVCDPYCGGVVFKLTPGQGGNWSESTLYNVPGGPDGNTFPNSLVIDTLGNLYGTTLRGGPKNAGTVFELTPNQDGSWTMQDLYTFSDGLDGGYPSSGVTFDNSGNMYGEAAQGGSFACPMTGCGVVYELTPEAGTWKFRVVHAFNGLNGSKGDLPIGRLAIDGSGNMYGTTELGGNPACDSGYGCGTIFRLSPSEGGGFSFRMVGKFNDRNGSTPLAGVIADAVGNLYGTTFTGGDPSCECGVVFEITP